MFEPISVNKGKEKTGRGKNSTSPLLEGEQQPLKGGKGRRGIVKRDHACYGWGTDRNSDDQRVFLRKSGQKKKSKGERGTKKRRKAEIGKGGGLDICKKREKTHRGNSLKVARNSQGEDQGR